MVFVHQAAGEATPMYHATGPVTEALPSDEFGVNGNTSNRVASHAPNVIRTRRPIPAPNFNHRPSARVRAVEAIRGSVDLQNADSRSLLTAPSHQQAAVGRPVASRGKALPNPGDAASHRGE